MFGPYQAIGRRVAASLVLSAWIAAPATAKPIAFANGTTIMGEYGAGTMEEAQAFYAPYYWLSVGAGFLRLDSDASARTRDIQYLRVNYLAHRWNLEEAQAMCKRVAMLKLGKVVTLDTMASLVRRISGSQLIVNLTHGDLPDELRALITHPETSEHGRKYSLRINEYAEVEQILRRLRESGAIVDEMQLQQADLEDIFIQIMEKGTV